MSVPPSCTLFIASEFSRACASVLTAQNSTPCDQHNWYKLALKYKECMMVSVPRSSGYVASLSEEPGNRAQEGEGVARIRSTRVRAGKSRIS